MKRIGKALLYVSVVALPAIMMTFKILQTSTIGCEVCIEFHGKKDCRNAQGPSKEECQRTATDNACALLAQGMTESLACAATEPSQVVFP